MNSRTAGRGSGSCPGRARVSTGRAIDGAGHNLDAAPGAQYPQTVDRGSAPEQLKRSPRLCLTYAMLLAALADFEAVEPYLQDARVALQRLPQDEATTRMLGEVDSLWANLACNRGDLPRAIALCQRALERIPRDEVVLRSTIFLTLGTSYVYSGELAAAEQALAKALELSQAAGHLYDLMHALYLLAWKHTASGHLHLAYRTYQRALHLVESHPQSNRSPHVSLSSLMLGEILRE